MRIVCKRRISTRRNLPRYLAKVSLFVLTVTASKQNFEELFYAFKKLHTVRIVIFIYSRHYLAVRLTKKVATDVTQITQVVDRNY